MTYLSLLGRLPLLCSVTSHAIGPVSWASISMRPVLLLVRQKLLLLRLACPTFLQIPLSRARFRTT